MTYRRFNANGIFAIYKFSPEEIEQAYQKSININIEIFKKIINSGIENGLSPETSKELALHLIEKLAVGVNDILYDIAVEKGINNGTN